MWLLSTRMDTLQISIYCAKIAHHPSLITITHPSLTHTQKFTHITITTSPLQRSRFLSVRCDDNKFTIAASDRDSAPAAA
jgi:hypothetical protein